MSGSQRDTLPNDHTSFLSGSRSGTAGPGVSCQNSKVVPMERRNLAVISIHGACGDEALGKSRNRVFTTCFHIFGLCVVFALCHCEFLAHLDRRGLVFSDSAELDFLHPRLGIEVPCAILGHQRDGEGPVFWADVQYRASIGLSDQSVHLLILWPELLALESVLHFVA